MYEFHIRHTETNESKIVFGYSVSDACRRANLEPQKWEVEMFEYVD